MVSNNLSIFGETRLNYLFGGGAAFALVGLITYLYLHHKSQEAKIPPSPKEFSFPSIESNKLNRFTSPSQKRNLANCDENTHLTLQGTTYKVAAIFYDPKPAGASDGYSFDYQEYQFKVKASGTETTYCLAPLF